MKYGHNGKNLVQYMVMASIAKTEKLTLVDVPFDGDGKQIPALLGEHIPIATVAISSVTSLWKAKKVKILAALTEKRADFAPDVPTLAEAGYRLPYPGFVGLFAPKGTPDEIAIQEAIHTRKGVERCIRYAFEYCRKRNRRHKVTLCGKTNVLTYAFDLGERTFHEVAKEFDDIETDHHILTLKIYKTSKNFPVEERFSLTPQIRRAAASICTNLMEGSHRLGRKEFRQFVGIPKG